MLTKFCQSTEYTTVARARARSALLLLTLGLSCASSFVSAQWSSGASVDAFFNDNISRSPYADHVFSDTSLNASLWRGFHLQISGYTALQLQGSLSREQFDHFGALSNTRLSGSAELSHKFGLGANTPVLSATAAIERGLFNDTHRDETMYRVSTALRQRIMDSLQISAALSYERRDGDYGQKQALVPPAPPLPTNVWDLSSWQLAASAEWDISPSNWLSSTVTYRDGDIVASTPPYPKILAASSAVAFDPVFGAGVVAYRMEATSRMLALDWNHAVSEFSTLYIGGERQWTRGQNGLGYGTNIIRAGFLHNF